jgi:2-methylcitrate dehydratase PrpD
MDAIKTFAKHVIDVRYETLPPEVVETTKKQVMNTLAVAIAGSAAQAVGELVEIYRDWGGKPESTVWVYGDKFPSIVAGQINATMVHARDFDDTHDAALLHPSVVAIPAGFAIAERLGNVDGKTFITAVALGIDLC